QPPPMAAPDEAWARASKRIKRDRRQAEYLSRLAGQAMVDATAERLTRITPGQFDVYTSYTRNATSKFNGPGRAGKPPSRRQVLLAEALGRLPKFEGTVWRGIALQDAAATIRAWQNDGVIMDAGFASASLDEGEARRFAQGGVLLKIEGKSGVYMAPLTTLARLRKEQEVLFPRSARFRILRVLPPSGGESLWIVEVEGE
ncbi:MAG: ADP-ribosyltransferase, partial [Candidatus Binataceae bacterium]